MYNCDFKFDVGETAQDIITKYKGTIVSRINYITGCNRYGLQPVMKKDGSVPEAQYFDENSLKKLLNKKIVTKKVPKKAVGGYKPPLPNKNAKI